MPETAHTAATERPDDCECDEYPDKEPSAEVLADFDIEPLDTALPCWPCSRDGFDTPNRGEE